MKWSKILGLVLFMHFLVIGVLLIYPGCKWLGAGPQTPTPVGGGGGAGVELTPAVGHNGPPDPAFNQGFALDPVRQPPTRPQPLESFESIGEPPAPPPTPAPATGGAHTGIGFGGEGELAPGAPPELAVHTVASGETLTGIAGRYQVPLSALFEANGLGRNSIIRPGQEIFIPRPDAAVEAPEAPAPAGSGEGTLHIVQRGDNLGRLAVRYGVSVAAIRSANGMAGDTIRIGQTLTIPGTGGAAPPAPSPAPAPSPSPSIPAGAEVHVVAKGESPGLIAARYGMTTAELMQLNSITDPRKLQIGQKLIVSAAATTSAAGGAPRSPVGDAPAPPTTPAPADPGDGTTANGLRLDPAVPEDPIDSALIPVNTVE